MISHTLCISKYGTKVLVLLHLGNINPRVLQRNIMNQTFGNKNQTVINQTMPAEPTSSLPA